MNLEEKRKDKKKIIITILGILLMATLMIGISYAYWSITKEQTTTNKLLTGCLDLSLTEEKNAINLTNAYPITDEDGKKLTPYSFKITNTCDLFASYEVNLEMLEGTTLNSKYIKVMVNKEAIQNLGSLETTNTTIANSTEARKLASGSLGSGDSEEYSIRIWMVGDLTIEDKEAMNKKMLSKVVVTASPSTYNPVENGITLLKDAILANEYQTTNIEVAKERIANKQAVDFSKTAPIIDWKENHASSTSTYTVTLPDPSLVGSGIEGTENLTASNILPEIGTGYTFDSKSGMYTIVNPVGLDPSTLDFNNNDYYFTFFTIETSSSKLIVNNFHGSQVLRKIENVKKEGTTFAAFGRSYKGVRYTFTVHDYTQNVVESDKSDKGIYQINDADGISYYYRGNVVNNNVYFGGFYWKILRINGDGSIRLIYNGKEKDGGSVVIGESQYNEKADDPAYVGYMYGSTLGVSYEQTNANEVTSTVKKYLDSWYKTNIEDKGFSNHVADSGFCNDRGVDEGDGFSRKYTRYNPYSRLRKNEVSLLCNKNDLFTKSNTKGNGKLLYAIGLPTLEDLHLAGLHLSDLNPMSFVSLRSGGFKTMSPMIFIEERELPVLGLVSDNGFVTSTSVGSTHGIRPVINLKADTEISGGIGTSNEPFIIK